MDKLADLQDISTGRGTGNEEKKYSLCWIIDCKSYSPIVLQFLRNVNSLSWYVDMCLMLANQSSWFKMVSCEVYIDRLCSSFEEVCFHHHYFPFN